MPNTTNFNWPTPADTDLVKDGAAAIRNLGDGVDTSLVDLKGGTTGQILSKASNTDLDYTWIANDQGDITEVQAGVGISIASGTGPIPVITNSSTDLITTAGDILYGTAADTVARLGIGTANQVLKVNSGATAPEWAVDPTTDVVTTAGDLIYATAADTVTRLGIGTAGQVLQVNAGATAPEWAASAGGKVLQVVQGLKTDTASSTSATLVGTGVSASITPSSTNSKILVLCSASFGCNPANTQITWGLFRGATQIFLGDAAGNRQRSSGTTNINNSNYLQTMAMSFLDSPATTSATTYEIYFRSESSNQIYLNRTLGDSDNTWVSRSASSIILLEIGA
jgi:hypothetical protein